MLIREIASSPSLEMSYGRAKAEAVITGRERPINDHLMKLLCIDSDAAVHWRKELVNWLDEIAEIRLKPNNRPGSSAFYYRILFDEPFGGVEEKNMNARLARLVRDGYDLRPEIEVTQVVEALRSFIQSFSAGCARGDLTAETIKDLLLALKPLDGPATK